MNITIVLAQIFGILLAVMGISIVINKKTVSAALREITRDQGVLWLWGVVALVIGVVFTVLNNNWTYGLPLFVTILGWLALVKGAFILIFPHAAVTLYRKCTKESLLVLVGLVALLVGLILLYQGFIY